MVLHSLFVLSLSRTKLTVFYINTIFRIYDQGHEVVGVDGAEQPILEFFQEQRLAFKKGKERGLEYYEVG